jgi:DNA-binding transcriptional ArsR family regulator
MAPADASSLQSIEFQAPGQFGGHLNETGEWALLIFKGQSAAFDLSMTGPVQYDNITEMEGHMDGYRGNATVPYQTLHQPSTFESLQAHAAFSHPAGSFYVEASHVRLVAQSFTGILKGKAADSCLGYLMSDTENSEHVARPQCSGTDDAALRAEIPPSGGAVGFQIIAEDVSKVEWYSAEIACQSAACPSGGGSSKTTIPLPLGRSLTSTAYSYSRFEANGGRLMGSGNAAVILSGGRSMDLDVAGWVRLPEPSTQGDCSPCLDLANHTLWAKGDVQLRALQRASADSMAARFGGNLSAVYLDETAVPKATLQALGWAMAGAAAAATAAAILVYKIITAGLFTRLFEDRAIQNPRRKRIQDYVQRHPGATLRELSRATGIPRTSLRTHVIILLRGRVLREVGQGVNRHFFPAKTPDQDWPAAILLRDPAMQRLLDWLRRHPEAQQKNALDHAETWGWQRTTTQYRLGKLVKGGLLDTRKQGKTRTYTARRSQLD